MSIRQLRPSLLFDSNIYVILGLDKTALVDTGTGFASDSYIEEIKGILGDRKLDAVFLTHRHYDHVGGLSRIIKEFSPSEIYAGHADAEVLRQGDSESTLGYRFGGRIEPMNVEDFRENDSVDIGGHNLRCIETPGHTSGSISIIDEFSKSLFSGDTVFINGVGSTKYPTGSNEMLINSLKKLQNMNVIGLYPGHGPTVGKNGGEYIKKGLLSIGCMYESPEM